MAAWVRTRTAEGIGRVAARLGMGHEVSITRALCWTREDKAAMDNPNEPEAELGT